MTFVSFALNSPVIAAGQTISGKAQVVLNKDTDVSDIFVQFKGVSTTYKIVQEGQSTIPVWERHVHVNVRQSLLKYAAGGTMRAGKHEFVFEVKTPVWSACKCLPKRDQYFTFKKQLMGWSCLTMQNDLDPPSVLLPPSMYASKHIYVEYRVQVGLDRPGIFNFSKSASQQVHVISPDNDAKGLNTYSNDERGISERRVLMAKFKELPEAYLALPGSLKKSSGVHAFFSNGINLDVPLTISITVPNSACIKPFEPIEAIIILSVEADCLDALQVIDVRMDSFTLVLKQDSVGTVMTYNVTESSKVVLLDRANLDLPIKFLQASNNKDGQSNKPPSARLDSLVTEAFQVAQDVVPSFEIFSMRHSHRLKASVGISVNNRNAKVFKAQVPVTIRSGVQVDDATGRVVSASADWRSLPYDTTVLDVKEKSDFFD
ncbi:hypothetical protein V1514DRAFT_6 [Lipomyces japonicus]|uniref:uncharacterized protein n=1 Tax=Lipomyces japonicus TaxID=56871 RepID=UPI0034CF8CEC